MRFNLIKRPIEHVLSRYGRRNAVVIIVAVFSFITTAFAFVLTVDARDISCTTLLIP